MSVPYNLPRPPAILVPPKATAAMASSSYPTPIVGCAEPNLERTIRPETDAKKPEAAYTKSLDLSVFTPANLAAFSLLPVAYTLLQVTVLERMKKNIKKHTKNVITGIGSFPKAPLPNPENTTAPKDLSPALIRPETGRPPDKISVKPR